MAEQLDLPHAGMVSFGQRPFLTEVEQLDAWQPDVAIVGAPFDVSTTNRPGARFGPRAIRATAYEPGTYHMDLGLEIFDWLEVVDFGDAHCPHGQTERSHANIRERVHAVASRGIVPVVLGGDHSITWPAPPPSPTSTATATSASSTSTPTPTPPTSSRATWLSHGTPMRRLIESGRRARHPLRAGRPARLLAAAGHVRVDARAGHDVAHDAGDLGPRLQGGDARRRRRGAGEGRQALHLRRHRRARPGVRPGHRHARAGRHPERRPAADGPPAVPRARRRRRRRRRGRPAVRRQRPDRQRRPPRRVRGPRRDGRPAPRRRRRSRPARRHCSSDDDATACASARPAGAGSLLATVLGSSMAHARRHRRQPRPAPHRRRPRRVVRRAAVDPQRLHARPRRADPPRRRARRPLRPAAHVRHRRRRLHARVACCAPSR